MKKFLFIILLLSFYSCKGKTFKVWKVSNESSGTITLYFKDVSTSEYKTRNLAPSAVLAIKVNDTRQTITKNKEPNSYFSPFVITNSIGDTCTKMYEIEYNWTYNKEITSKPKRTYLNYVFSVNDSNF